MASTGDLVQPVQWSSEMNDGELALVYYNYRYYNPADGRWITRDPIAEEGGWNLYRYILNNPTFLKDYIGILSSKWMWIPVIQKEMPSFRNEKHDIDYNWGNTIVDIYLHWRYNLEYDSGHFEVTAISINQDTEWWTDNPAGEARGAQSTITGKISCEEKGNIKYSFSPAVYDYATNLPSSSGLLLSDIKKEEKELSFNIQLVGVYQGILIPPFSIGRGKITISGEIPGRTIIPPERVFTIRQRIGSPCPLE